MKRLVAAVLLVTAACGGAPSLLEEHRVDLFEFGIDAAPTWSPATTVSVYNSGGVPHTLVITQEDGRVVFASSVVAPGETTDVDVNLPAGEYQVTCRLVAQTDAGELVDHYERGMHADLVVTN